MPLALLLVLTPLLLGLGGSEEDTGAETDRPLTRDEPAMQRFTGEGG